MNELIKIVEEQYKGNAVQAMYSLSYHYRIPFAYLNREVFNVRAEEHRGSSLTDEEWEKVWNKADEEYDPWVDNSTCGEKTVPNGFMDWAMHQAGIDKGEEDPWDNEGRHEDDDEAEDDEE